MNFPVIYERKVRYSDTDAQGHVFNVNYFRYFDDAITDYMDVAMGPGEPEGYDMLLAHAEADFKSSAQLGEEMSCGVRVERIGNTSITFYLEITNKKTGALICTGKEIYVIVEKVGMPPMPVPDAIKEAIARLQET